ncbi:uncharacterized protein LOC116338201 [Contarinia nasturtii]|uniref:uncharacterized protein LOC116338201 n=1 Tax=Contarinia nasturtii TaxID=265458 RepID=UPI0012D3C1F6|nr:uncharacterized protein LOC116338201 [Contarinia nasturtii]
MKLLFQVIFAVAIFAGATHCNLCGPRKETPKPPNLDQIFKKPSFYTIHPENLVQKHQVLRSSIEHVKTALEGLKSDASDIFGLLENGLNEFDKWGKTILNFDKSNLEYVTEVFKADKKLMKDNSKEIKKYSARQMSDLEDMFIAHEKKAATKRDDIEKIVNLMMDEMTQRNNAVYQILEQFNSAKQFLEFLKPSISLETIKMNEIAKAINSH